MLKSIASDLVLLLLGCATVACSLEHLDAFNQEVCGKAEVGLVPWSVMLRQVNSLVRNTTNPRDCAGLLIHHNLVVTNARCFQKSKVKRQIALAGLSNWLDIAGMQQVIVSKFCSQNKGLAVARLQESFAYTERVRPICLHKLDAGEPPHRTQCQTAGWGLEANEGRFSDELKSVAVVECLPEASRSSPEGSSCLQTLERDASSGELCSRGNSGSGLACQDGSASNLFYASGILDESRGEGPCKPGSGVAFADYLDLYEQQDVLSRLIKCALTEGGALPAND